jgi:putative membrane protein
MRTLALVFIALIAVLHFYIAWFEIFSWTTRGPKVFTDFPSELFEQTVQMAANQGIYNAFLAVGLTWALLIKDRDWQVNVATCFLLFVATAGVFGAITVTTKTLLIQTFPALIALSLLLFSHRATSQR